MKPPVFWSALAVLLAVVSRLASAQAPATGMHKPILPLAPAELLRFLPAPPPNWKTTDSKASNFFMEWIRCEASREFVMVVPEMTPGASPAPTRTTRVRIFDTGYYPAFSGDFEEFTAGKYGAGESLLVGSFQAHRIPLGADGERLRVSVRRRFIVEIDTHNQPSGTGATWLKSVDMDRLQQVSDAGPDKLPHAIVCTRLDELDPKNNSTYTASWMSDEELNKVPPSAQVPR